MLRALTSADSWADSSNKAYFIIALNISCRSLTTTLEVKSRMAVSVLPVHLRGSRADLEPRLLPSPHIMREYPVANRQPRKDQNPKYCFYWMYIASAPPSSWNTISQTIVSQGPAAVSLQSVFLAHILLRSSRPMYLTAYWTVQECSTSPRN